MVTKSVKTGFFPTGSRWPRAIVQMIAIGVAGSAGTLVLLQEAQAQATWLSATNGTWGDTANWSTGIVPGAGNNTAAVLDANDSSYTVTYDTANSSTLAGFLIKNTIGNTTTLNINTTGFVIAGNGTVAATPAEMAYATINVNSGGEFRNTGRLGASGANNSVVVDGGLLTNTFDFGYAPVLLDGVKIGLTLSSGTINTSGGFFFPTLTMTSGSLSASGSAIVGLNGGTISGGTFTNTSTGANGLHNRSGLLTITGSADVTTTGLVNVGNNANITIAGGTVEITGTQFYVGNNNFTGNRTANITQSGGSVTSTNAAGLVVGFAAGANAATSDYSYRLSGGTLEVAKITLAAAGYVGAGTNRFTMTGGTLELGSGGIVIGSGSGVKAVQLSGGVIGAQADWSSSADLSLLTGTGTGIATFRAADADGVAKTITLSGILGGAGALTKTGGGVLELTNTNGFTGGTTVTAGRLLLSGSGSINASSGLTLDGGELRQNSLTALTRSITFGGGGGTISGTGEIASVVTAGAGAILSPGNSPGIQEYSSGLVWNPGGTYVWETNALLGTAGTNWDVIAVSGGPLDLSGLSSLNQFVLDPTTLGAGNIPGALGGYEPGTYAFDIATFATLLVPDGYATTANSILTDLFSFNELVNWQGTQPSSLTVQVNSSGNGLELNLVIVPEPTAGIIAGMGMLLAGWSLGSRRGRPACHPG